MGRFSGRLWYDHSILFKVLNKSKMCIAPVLEFSEVWPVMIISGVMGPCVMTALYFAVFCCTQT